MIADTITVRLGDICEIGSSKRVKMADYKSSGIPFLRSKEVIELSKNQEISLELFIDIEHYNKIDTKFGVPKIDDILLTSVGTIGVPLLVSPDMLPFYFKDGNLIWFSNFSEKVNPKWLYHWLKSEIGQNQIHAFSIGSTQKALTIEALRKIKLSIPNREKQDRVANVLENYSDYLQLSNRTIRKLSDTIQALFRSWFIDFDPVKSKSEGKLPYGMDEETAALFPDTFEDSELGPIPTGWSVIKMKEGLSFLKDGDHTPPKRVEQGIPLYSGKDVNNGYFLDTSRPTFVTKEYHDWFHRKWEPKIGDILIASVGSVGKTAIVRKDDFPFILQRSVALLRPNNKINSEYLLYYMQSQSIQWLIESLSVRSVQATLSLTDISNIPLLLPPIEILEKFRKICELMHSQYDSKIDSTSSLSYLRDVLLPRLISGELEI